MTLFTLAIFLGPFLDYRSLSGFELVLSCDGKSPYPFRFLAIWLFDFVSAFWSIMVIMYEKRFVTDKAMLRLARRMDIENHNDEFVKKFKERKQKQELDLLKQVEQIESESTKGVDLQRYGTFTVQGKRPQTMRISFKGTKRKKAPRQIEVLVTDESVDQINDSNSQAEQVEQD